APGRFPRLRTNLLGTLDIGRESLAIGRDLVARGRRRHRDSLGVVDELDVNVFASKTDRHARALRRAHDLLADTPFAQLSMLLLFLMLHVDKAADLAAA